MLLAVKGRGSVSSGEKVAQDLARDAAREQLKPMLETACSRLASVLYHSFNVAVEHQQSSAGLSRFRQTSSGGHSFFITVGISLEHTLGDLTSIFARFWSTLTRVVKVSHVYAHKVVRRMTPGHFLSEAKLASQHCHHGLTRLIKFWQ